MSIRNLFVIVFAVLCASMLSCTRLSNETTITEYFKGEAIKGFVVDGPAKVMVTKSSTNDGMLIRVNSSIQNKVNVRKDSEGVVYVELRNFGISNYSNLVFEININATDLKRASASGACEVTFDNSVAFTPFKTDINLSGASTMRGLNLLVTDELSLDLSGASTIKGQSFMSANKLSLDVSGASDITANAAALYYDFELSGASSTELQIDKECAEMDVELEGASDLKINTTSTGISNVVKADVSGASKFNASDYKFKTGNIKLSGASSAKLWIVERIEAKLSGASTLRLKGNPSMNITEISGGSNIETY